MSLSKKDYEEVAARVRDLLTEKRIFDSQVEVKAFRLGVAATARRMSIFFEDRTRYDRHRFYEACGLDRRHGGLIS